MNLSPKLHNPSPFQPTENNIEITPEFENAITAMTHGPPFLFITGKAGTGKSTLLTYFRNQTTQKIAVLAPTGVAALHIKGETIHSFFRFKPNITIQDAYKKGSSLKKTAFYETLDTIIIDEISMVRADLIDCIDHFLRGVLKTHQPFGGKRIIGIGDLYQLPPIVSRTETAYFNEVYSSPYFFSAQAIRANQLDIEIIELPKIYRQTDHHFIDILNAVRTKTISHDQLNQLNQQVDPDQTLSTAEIQLTTTVARAVEINKKELVLLSEELFTHTASLSSSFKEKMAPTDIDLALKIGAQIMFVTNNSMGLWVNGTLGEIIDIDPETPELLVKTQDQKTVSVTPHKWTIHKHIYNPKTQSLEQETAGTFTQFPLQLAWAVTIHKSQGKTFQNVAIDLGYGAFAKGQVYVALSRCKSLEGIRLIRPVRHRDILVDATIAKFLDQMHHNWA